MGRHVLIAGLLLAASAGGAAAQAGGCSGPETHRIMVPVDYGGPQGPRFPLTYRLRDGTADRPTIVVIPGGPGASTIEDDPNVASGAIPASYRVVLTDPRGAGCNDDPALADDRDFSSEILARDVLAIIAAQAQAQAQAQAGAAGGRPFAYVLYGHSYGTVVATIAASLAASDHLPAPRAVVLEGTIGRAYPSYAAYFAPFQAEWRQVRDALPLGWQAAFRHRSFPAPLPPSVAAWALLVENDLLRGYRPDGEHELDWQLSSPGGMALAAGVSYFAQALRGAVAGQSRLLRTVACRELFGALYPFREFRGGELLIAGDNACGDAGGFARPWDAAAWPVEVPLIYVQGEHDPATPPAQTRYHVEHETTAPRYLVSVSLAAHDVLGFTLATADCPDRFWQAVTGGLDRLEAAVARCDALVAKAHVTMRRYAPEPMPADRASLE